LTIKDILAMKDARSIDELKDLGSGKPAPSDIVRL
jgi:hypothetical protein